MKTLSKVKKEFLRLLIPKKLFSRIYTSKKNENQMDYADEKILGKAVVLKERFREIVSDPINVLIERVPNAGYLDSDKKVILHNGIRVPVGG